MIMPATNDDESPEWPQAKAKIQYACNIKRFTASRCQELMD